LINPVLFIFLVIGLLSFGTYFFWVVAKTINARQERRDYAVREYTEEMVRQMGFTLKKDENPPPTSAAPTMPGIQLEELEITKCLLCRSPINKSEENTVGCPRCKAVSHKDCVASFSNSKCGTYGCSDPPSPKPRM
jgi:hypothetical protein